MKHHRVVEHGHLHVHQLGESTIKQMDAHWNQHRFSGKRPYRKNDHLVFAGDCGVIGLADCQIEVAPKLFGDEEQGMTVLMRMLKRVARHLHHYPRQGSMLTLQNHVLLDIMIELYLDLLESQVRQGLLRQYTTRHETLTQVRGKLDIHRYLCEPHPLHFPVVRRPLQVDNPINRALKASLHLLLGHATRADLNKRTTQLLRAFEEVEDAVPPQPVLDALQVGRPQARWTPVLDWAKAFLRGHSPGIRSGQLRVCSLLFPMHQLFQDFIHTCLADIANAHAWKLSQGSEHHLANPVAHAGKPLVQLRPDHILRDPSSQVAAILDSKWKVSEQPGREDLYQLFAYARIYGAPKVGLLYPSDCPLPTRSYRYADGTELILYYIDMTHLVESQARFDTHLAENLGLFA